VLSREVIERQDAAMSNGKTTRDRHIPKQDFIIIRITERQYRKTGPATKHNRQLPYNAGN
jgi:hypothetical protein